MPTSTRLARPVALRPGDRVAVATTSWAGAHEVPHRFDVGVAQLAAAFDLEVVELPHTRADQATLTPAARAADLHAAFADASIAGIVSTIGGDDSIRMLPHLDLDLVAANPKVLLGYSDTTITQMACLRAGLVTFYGPSILSGFAENGGLHDYLREGVRAALFDPGPTAWRPNPDGWTAQLLDWDDPTTQEQVRDLRPSTGWRWLRGGEGDTGRLLPACIEVLDMLRGTPWWPDLDGTLLAIETSEEAMPPGALARMLRPLGVTGELASLAGLLLGRPGGMEIDGVLSRPADEAYDEAVVAVMDEFAPHVPIVTGLDFGHTDPMWTLPIGVEATLRASRDAIDIASGVTAPTAG